MLHAISILLTAVVATPFSSSAAGIKVIGPAGQDANDPERLMTAARAHADLGEFEQSIEKYQEAFVLLSGQRAWQQPVRWELQRAHRLAFESSKDDVRHLQEALRYLRQYDENWEDADEHSRQEIADEITVIEQLQSDAEAAAEPELDPEPVETEEIAKEPASIDPMPIETREPTKPWKPLVISGGVLAGLGIGSGVLAVVGLVRHDAYDAQFEGCRAGGGSDCNGANYTDWAGKTKTWGNVGVATGIVGGALLVTGIAVLAAGINRKRRGVAAAEIALGSSGGVSVAF